MNIKLSIVCLSRFGRLAAPTYLTVGNMLAATIRYQQVPAAIEAREIHAIQELTEWMKTQSIALAEQEFRLFNKDLQKWHI